MATEARSDQSPTKKDEKYYRSDGDCTIQVEDVLFKIHRYHLSEDSTIFGSMFNLPSGALSSEGEHDYNPIILHGDTLPQIRAFLSVAYSNPGELQINRMSVGDMEGLSNIVPFAHKYLLQHCLLWALQSMEHILLNYAADLPGHQFPTILRVAVLCTPNHPSICEVILTLLQAQWLARIKDDTLPLVPAIDIAAVFNLRDLLVELYCLVLDRLSASPDPTRAMETPPFSELSPNHRARIFSGFWVFCRSLETLIRTPPSVHRPDCGPASMCRISFATAWYIHCSSKPRYASPTAILQGLDDLKGAMLTRMSTSADVTCSVEVGIDAAIAAFKTSLTNSLFVFPEDNI
ncbi:hypothetical protein C8R46DRAFT_1349198 [Mycena filopes]|nr:hypothetical protein C8R46DRAFT_1349198 [Mycena filopes]